MKKLITIAALLLLVPCSAFAWGTMVIGGGGGGGSTAECTSYDSATADSSEAYVYIGRYTSQAFVGQVVDESVSDICQVSFYLWESGTVTSKYYMALAYDVSSEDFSPESPIAYSDAWLAGSTLEGTARPGTKVDFTFNTSFDVADDAQTIVITQFINLDVDGSSWAASSGDTGAYYYDTTPGYTPSLIFHDNTPMTKGTAGSLADGEWAFTDQDTIGENRIYVQIAGGDPDGEDAGDIKQNNIDASNFGVIDYTSGTGGTLDSGFGHYTYYEFDGDRNSSYPTKDLYYEVYSE